jgi:hypothetical protein
MNKDIIIIDGFYNNPEQVYSYALGLDYSIKGNYPGMRSEPEPPEQSNIMRDYFGTLLGARVTSWPREYNSAYQLTLETDTTWIHHDATEYAAVVYLTPNAPIDSGTAFYRLKETQVDRWNVNDPSTDYNDKSNLLENPELWDRTATVGNVFNRCVLFRGELYHRSDRPGFGTSVADGRITQTFFFGLG